MTNFLGPLLNGMVGTALLFGLLPIVIAVSLGLVIVGLIRGRMGAVVAGVAFPIVTVIVGTAMRTASLADVNAPESLGQSMASLEPFVIYSIGGAAIVFLVTILPGIVRAARNR